MGVTFKISKTGRNFRPKVSTESVTPNSPEQLNPKSIVLSEKSKAIVEIKAGDASVFSQSSLLHVSPGSERLLHWKTLLRLCSRHRLEMLQRSCIRMMECLVGWVNGVVTKTPDKNLATQLLKFLMKYRPEDRAAKKDRLLKKAQAQAEGKPYESKKPIVVKYGLNHVTYLIEQNKTQLVVIAHDVDPIDLVVWLPALCRKMEVPYCIVKGKSRPGTVITRFMCAGVEDSWTSILTLVSQWALISRAH